MDSSEYRSWVNQHVEIGSEVLWITRKEIEELDFTRREIYEITEKALVYHGRKECEMPAKIGLHPKTQKDTLMHAMPAYIPAEFSAGIKWGGCFPENREKFGLAQTSALMIFNDHESGWPIAVTDGVWITQVRTPAVTAVAAKYLANTDSTTFGMIGCGVQGREHVKTIELALQKLEKIYVYDVYQPAMDSLINECQPLVKAKIIKVDTIEKLVKSAEVICSATIIKSKPDPKIKDDWIIPGQTIFMCDMHSLYEDETVKRADKYIVDSIEQHTHFVSLGYYPYGLPEIYAETGEVVAGLKKGRETKKELIINNNVGMAIEDVMLIRQVVDRAIEKKAGRIIPL